ncbi:MAG: hypothetical protein J1E64_14995 [Acetatifactor sp.]|nr:hypothetical protein [Acetatifactor sp.]
MEQSNTVNLTGIIAPAFYYQRNGKITGIVFVNQEEDEKHKKCYTRLEYYRFLDTGVYAISNKCYVGSSPNDTSKIIAIDQTPWAGLLEEAQIENINNPLYGVLRTPHANNVDISSPLGLPIFADAIEELKDLDIAYSRNAKEIKDSKRTVLLDSDRLFPHSGNAVKGMNDAILQPKRDEMGLPDYVKNVWGDGQESFY